VVEGTTENKAVCLRLVTGLHDRGLDADRGVLFVLDGGKALGAAVRAVFGANALVQRCRRHKERNVTDHLPEAERPLMQRRLRSAWAIPDPDHAQHELEALARGLTRQRPGAAASLREGLAETLTVNRLGVGGKLLQTLESTNPIESMIEIVRDHAGRVKRWSSGEMALGGGRDARRRSPVPPGQGLPGAPPTRRRAPTRHRRRAWPTRPRCHRLTVGSVMEAPPKSNGERDILCWPGPACCRRRHRGIGVVYALSSSPVPLLALALLVTPTGSLPSARLRAWEGSWRWPLTSWSLARRSRPRCYGAAVDADRPPGHGPPPEAPRRTRPPPCSVGDLFGCGRHG
jgi:Transposase, Mutator family